jgi:16S rRNA (guanine966-N2)-methyltransferase
MRVIAGAARGTPLAAPPGAGTRPTSDLLKGTIFNMLAAEGPFERVVDLYAGSGALGIEALSRGAAHTVFVERQPRACQTIRQNLRAARLEGRATVLCGTLPGVLGRLDGPFDLALLDPPYDTSDLPEVLARLATPELLAPGALVVAEHRATTALPEAIGDLVTWKQRRHGDGALRLYRYAPEGAAAESAGAMGEGANDVG